MESIALALALTALTSSPTTAQPEISTALPSDTFQPCTQAPCGLGFGYAVNREPMKEETLTFIRLKLAPTVLRAVENSAYFEKLKTAKHCTVTFRIMIAPGKTVANMLNMQERENLFFEEFDRIFRQIVTAWRGDFPADIIYKPFI